MLLGPLIFSKFSEHPVLFCSSALGYWAVAKKLSSSLYRGLLGIIKKSPELHSAICDARIKFADNRRRFEKATLLRE